MPDGLYDRDILAWSEHQAALLRRLAAGERLNEAVDWPNLIEEVQDLGLSELRALRSLLRQAMLHLLKLNAWPHSTAANHWRAETLGFLADARDRYSASMAQRLDLPGIYRTATAQLALATDDSGLPNLPWPDCPWTLDQLLADPPPWP